MEVVSVCVSQPRSVTIGGIEVSTGIFKKPVKGPIKVKHLNLEGDGQGDLRVHGGENMAIYAYPIEHYPFWEKKLNREEMMHGQFGENLTINGLTEGKARVGSIYRIGSALLQVTQPRIPCFKLVYKMDAGPDFAKRFMESRRMGFYFRVIEEGEIRSGDKIELIDEAVGSVTIAEFIEFTQFQSHDPIGLRRVLDSRDLSTGPKGWREHIEMMIETAETRSTSLCWEVFRTFIVDRKVKEIETVTSFYIIPEDGTDLPDFKPGQFLTFKLYIEGQPRPLIRTYSISDSPNHKDYYRISIKRETAPKPGVPDGISSNFFHDQVKVGTKLCVKAPRGQFYLDEQTENPIVLLSAGVGITPMMSMINTIVESGSQRLIWFIHGARNGREHIMADHIKNLANEIANINVHISYSQPLKDDIQGKHFDSQGRINMNLLKRILPDQNFDFYLCGPTPFMKDLYNGISEWGVDESRVRYEFFGPKKLLKTEKKQRKPERITSAIEESFQVNFARSGVTTFWTPSSGSLLDLAEAQGLRPDFSCRSGICQSCICELHDGEFEYFQEPLDITDPGCILICSAKPKSDIIINV